MLFTNVDGTVYTFDEINTNKYRLKSSNSTGGHSYSYTYNLDDKLQTVTDNFGRSANIIWDTSGYTESMIKEIIIPSTVKLTYNYDKVTSTTGEFINGSEKLTSIVSSNIAGTKSETTTYHYENTNNVYWVTGITDARGVRYATYTYHGDGRVSESVHANYNDKSLISYNQTPKSTTFTHALGKQSTFNFSKYKGTSHLDSVNELASTNTPAATSSQNYDAQGYISQDTDQEGRVTSYTKNSRGLVNTMVEGVGTPDAVTTTYSWHANFKRPTQIVQTGKTTDITYNSAGNALTVTETDTTAHTVPYSTNGQTRVWTLIYTPDGLVDTIDGPLTSTGDTINYDYTADGFISKFTNELGQITSVTALNTRGLPTSITNSNGVVTGLTYDFQGRVKSVVQNPGITQRMTAFEYDKIGQITKITLPDASTLSYIYNHARRLVEAQTGDGEKIEYAYDLSGNITNRSVRNLEGNITQIQTQAFDELDRLLKSIGALNQTTNYTYDKTSLLTSTTDPRTNTYAYAYDGLKRLIQTTDEEDDVANLKRDAQHNVTEYKDPRSLITSYVYNGFGDVIRCNSTDSGITDYVVNATGNVTQKTDARAVITNYIYDNMGRQLTKTFPASTIENVAFTYDQTVGGNQGIGRLTQINDQSGTANFTYDVFGQIISETRNIQSKAYTTEYGYNAVGKIDEIVYPSGRIVNYWYDAEGRISSVSTKKNAGSPTKDVAYNIDWMPLGPLKSMDYGNGLNDWNTYNLDYDIDVLSLYDGATDVINKAHTRTDEMNLTNIWDNVITADNQSFWYSASNRLQNSSGPWGDLTFYHDGSGNRTHRISTQGGVTQTKQYGYGGADNHMADVETNAAITRTFTYDAAGNMLNDTRAGVPFAYAYNHASRLKSVTVSGSLKSTYLYNAQQQLASTVHTNQAVNGTIHKLYDLMGNLISDADVSGNVVREYMWLPQGAAQATNRIGSARPLAVVADVNTPTPNIYYVHVDHLQRPIMMTDASKTNVWATTWLPFGGAHSLQAVPLTITAFLGNGSMLNLAYIITGTAIMTQQQAGIPKQTR